MPKNLNKRLFRLAKNVVITYKNVGDPCVQTKIDRKSYDAENISKGGLFRLIKIVMQS